MNPVKKTLIECLIGIPVVFGLATLFDYLYQTVLQQNAYTFNLSTPLFCLGVWIVIEIVTLVIRKNKNEKQH